MRRRAKLVHEGGGTPREWALAEGEELQVGRQWSCAIRTDETSVSRMHARLWLQEGRLHLQDFDSVNGTFVNDVPVTRTTLAHGDHVRFGLFAIWILLEDVRQQTKVEDVPAPTQPTVDGPAAEIAQLTAERDEWRARAERLEARLAALPVDTLEAERQARLQAEAALAEARREIDEATRRAAQLERDRERDRAQVVSLSDQALVTRERARELATRAEEAERARGVTERDLTTALVEAERLRAALAAAAEARAEVEAKLRDLQREVRQHDRAREAAQAELDVAEYNLRAARDDAENLQLAYDAAEASRRQLRTELAAARELLAEQEAMLARLEAERKRQPP